MKKSTKYLKIFANLLVSVLVIFLIFYLCPKILIFFMPFVIGYIISLIANPMVRFLEKRLKIVRKHSSMIIIIGVLAAVILILYLAIGKLVEEIILLINNLPEIYENLAAEFNAVGDNLQIIVNRLPQNIQQSIAGITADFSAYISNISIHKNGIVALYLIASIKLSESIDCTALVLPHAGHKKPVRLRNLHSGNIADISSSKGFTAKIKITIKNGSAVTISLLVLKFILSPP